MAVTIAINGFGRIGRQLARLILSKSHPTISLKAVNTLEDIDTAAHLLKYDSLYGPSALPVSTEKNTLIVGSTPILFSNESNPENIPWSGDDIDIVIECSGTHGSICASGHRKSGVKKVIITAAANTPDITLCMGVNHETYDRHSHHIISGSSCTTNCIAPVAKIINDHFDVVSAMATIIHSYTNTQNILDSPHTNLRRARSATQNILPTNSSAAWQIPLVIPQLKNRFEALAIRVPTPLMHLADVSFLLTQKTNRNELIQLFTQAAKGSLSGIIALNHSPLVSTDFIGTPNSSIIDMENIYVNDTLIKLMLWHDNEFSYCSRILDLVNYISPK